MINRILKYIYPMNESQLFFERYTTLPSYLIYNTNAEYRDVLRKVFNLDTTKITPYAGLNIEDIYHTELIDDESKDEMLLDSTTLDKHMEYLYDLTKDSYIFKDLYIKAAGRMFSTDMKIGQAIVCSYDTFNMYHTCVWYYLVDPHSLESIPEYKKLYNYYN